MIDTFKGLLHLLQHYPTELSRKLIPYLYDLITTFLPSNPDASVHFASRHLKPDLTGANLVDALKATNEELLEATRNDTAKMDSAYAGWILEQFNILGDLNLVRVPFLVLRTLSLDTFSLQRIYLALSLHNLCSSIVRSSSSASHLMAVNLQLLSLLKSSSPIEPSKLLKLSRRYSSGSTHPRLWLARLDIEKQYGTPEDVSIAWNEARRNCRSDGSEAVWLWCVQNASLRQHEVGTRRPLRSKCLLTQDQELFLELLQQPFPSSDRIYENIFLSALSTLYSQNPDLNSRRDAVVRLFGKYLLLPTIFAHSFSLESSRSDASAALLEAIFRGWKDVPGQSNTHEDAYFAWSGWLLRSGQPKKAVAVMNGLLQQLHGDRKATAEMRWKKILDGDGDAWNDEQALEEEGNDLGVAIDAEADKSMSDAASLDGYESGEDILIVS